MQRHSRIDPAIIERMSKLECNSSNGEGGIGDFLSKFGPLIIAIIAVAFCFYIYTIVNTSTVNKEVLENFITEQTDINMKFQDSYNTMVVQFNKLASLLTGKEVPEIPIKDLSIENSITVEKETIPETISETIPEIIPGYSSFDSNTKEEVDREAASAISFSSTERKKKEQKTVSNK